MPRSNRPRNSKREDEAEELRLDSLRFGIRRTEFRKGTEYSVQTHNSGAQDDTKTWVCPHCNISINQGLSHLVAWDAIRGPETRRHFHTACWKAFQGTLL